MIEISEPWIDEATEKLVLEVLRSKRIARGPMVEDLERAFTTLTGTEHAIAVASGTAALETAVELLVEPGDTVATTPFTFAATINAALRAGARVRFIDIGDDFNLDPNLITTELMEGVSAVVPVHLYGLPCRMSELVDIARHHGAAVIEDAAQAVGASTSGNPVGSWGVGCFSLYATKNVAAGEGGVITTDDGDLARRARTLVNQGSLSPYQYKVIGTNRRMTDLQAAVALPQMQRLDSLTRQRRQNALRLTAGLRDIPGLITPADAPGHVYHQYTVRVTPDAKVDRDYLASSLKQRGIASGVYYPRLVHDYPCYRSHPSVEVTPTPNASRIATEVISIPVHPQLSTSDIDMIIANIHQLLDD